MKTCFILGAIVLFASNCKFQPDRIYEFSNWFNNRMRENIINKADDSKRAVQYYHNSFGLQRNQHTSNYEKFEICLQKSGFNSAGIVRRSNSQAYQNLNYQWQEKGPKIRPQAYLLVGNESEVIIAVKCARNYSMRIVPKGGGHSLEKFSFGNSASIIIDVRNLKTLTFKGKLRVSVGSGWQVGPLALELWELGNVFTPTGLCPTIGISGLATGGGHDYFSREFGLAIDNVLEFKIVTADGDLLTVNNEINFDLFWALRGGIASSFGIVTKIDFKVYPTPARLTFASLTYPRYRFGKVFDAWQKVVPYSPNEITSGLDILGDEISLTVLDWTGTGDNIDFLASKFPSNPTTFVKVDFTYEEYLAFNAQNLSSEILTTGAIYTAQDLGTIAHQSPTPMYQKRKSFFVEEQVGDEAVDTFSELIEQMPNTLLVFFEAFGGAISEIRSDATAFVHRNKYLYNAVADYKNIANNVTNHDKGTEFVENFFNLGELIFQHNSTYQNYIDEELTDYLERYYGSNLWRLIEIKTKYDPNNFFYNQQSIPTQILW